MSDQLALLFPPTEDACIYPACQSRWATLIPAGEVSLRIREAVLGLAPGQTEMLRLCWEHYRKLKRADGWTLGYRWRDGRLRTYVKAEHF